MIAGITLGFVRGPGPLSNLIEWFGGGYYSHVTALWCERTNVVIDSRVNRVMGVPPGVQMRPLVYLKGSRIDWLCVPSTSKQMKAFREALYSQVGKPYDKLGVLNFVMGRIRDRNFRNTSRWFCDDLIVWALEESGICPRLILPPPRITPGGAAIVSSALGAVYDSVPMP